MPDAEDFRNEIKERLKKGEKEGKPSLTITSGELHRSLGGYPGSNHRMPVCCSVMKEMMSPEDEILDGPPSGKGATLKIKYDLSGKESVETENIEKVETDKESEKGNKHFSAMSPEERKQYLEDMGINADFETGEDSGPHVEEFRKNPERAYEVGVQLYREFRTGSGIFGHKKMPEGTPPEGVEEGSYEHLMYVTMTVSIDYMRDATVLWKSARKTFEDPEVRWVFYPKKVVDEGKTSFKKLSRSINYLKSLSKMQKGSGSL